MARIVIAGCGYLGTALGLGLHADGHEVIGLRRDPGGLPKGILPLAFDLALAEPLHLPGPVDFAVYCVGAAAATEDAYRAAYVDGLASFLRALSDLPRPPSRVLFTSSTSVYAQREGEWIDERSPAQPRRFSGRVLLEAEALLRASGLPVTVVRLGGIYGPDRTGLLRRIAGGVVHGGGSPHYTNRIHRDDAARALSFLMLGRGDAAAADELYVGVDCEPALHADVVGFIAAGLGVRLPSETDDAVRPSPERTGSKRCSNARMLAAGYRFRFPTFRDGYRPLIAAHLAGKRDAPERGTR